MKRIVPVVILMILSVISIFSFNNNNESIPHRTDLSQVETSQIAGNSDIKNNIDENTAKIYWRNDYIMPCNITGESIPGFENDKLIFLSSVRLHGQPGYAPESTKSRYTEISHIHNNKEISEDIKYDMSQNQDYIATRNKIFTDDIKNIMVNDYYAEDSTGYDASKDSILLRTNAERNVIPWRVKYVNYCEESIKPKEAWIKEMSESLDEVTGGTDTPIVIWESWSFDFNGNEISFVNATNFADDNSLVNWNYPLDESYVYTENDIIYTASAFFCNEELIWFQINMDYYYVNDVVETDNESNSATLYLYQIDNNGNIVASPFHVDSTLWRKITVLANWYQPDALCVLDMNNDNNPEIVISEFTGLVREVSSYKYKNNTITNNGILFYIGGMRGEGYPLEYFPK